MPITKRRKRMPSRGGMRRSAARQMTKSELTAYARSKLTLEIHHNFFPSLFQLSDGDCGKAIKQLIADVVTDRQYSEDVGLDSAIDNDNINTMLDVCLAIVRRRAVKRAYSAELSRFRVEFMRSHLGYDEEEILTKYARFVRNMATDDRVTARRAAAEAEYALDRDENESAGYDLALGETIFPDGTISTVGRTRLFGSSAGDVFRPGRDILPDDQVMRVDESW